MFRPRFLICLVVLVLVMWSGQTFGVDGWDTVVVPDSPRYFTRPTDSSVSMISGDNLTWMWNSGSGEFVCFFDGSITTKLLRGSGLPAISGTNVVWISMSKLFFWDGQYIREIPRRDPSGSPTGIGTPRISGSNVVWVDYDANSISQVFFWDGNQRTQITNDGVTIYSSPIVSGTNVVWTGQDPNSNAQLYIWDGNDIFQITDYNDYNPSFPFRVSGSYVGWIRPDANMFDQVYLWDGNEITQITNNNSDIISDLEISDANLAWAQQNYLYFYNGSDIIQVWEGISGPITSFRMSCSNLAWTEPNIGSYEVYFWDGNETTQIANDSAIITLLGVSGRNIVWHVSDVGIFLAKFTGPPVTCSEVLDMGYLMDADINSDCKVNFKDIAAVADDWLRSFDPDDVMHETPWL